MPLPKLNRLQKKYISELYKHKKATQVELAEVYGVSRKTIYRALLDYDLVVPRRKKTISVPPVHDVIKNQPVIQSTFAGIFSSSELIAV